MTTQSWLWPDRTIGKRESRRLREEHNALVNEHTAMLDALRELLREVDAHLDYETDVEMGVAADVAHTILARIKGDQ